MIIQIILAIIQIITLILKMETQIRSLGSNWNLQLITLIVVVVIGVFHLACSLFAIKLEQLIMMQDHHTKQSLFLHFLLAKLESRQSLHS